MGAIKLSTVRHYEMGNDGNTCEFAPPLCHFDVAESHIILHIYKWFKININVTARKSLVEVTFQICINLDCVDIFTNILFSSHASLTLILMFEFCWKTWINKNALSVPHTHITHDAITYKLEKSIDRTFSANLNRTKLKTKQTVESQCKGHQHRAQLDRKINSQKANHINQ